MSASADSLNLKVSLAYPLQQCSILYWMRLLVDRRRHCVHSAGSELRCKLSSRDSCLCTLCKASTSSTSQSGRRVSSSAAARLCVRSFVV